VEPKEVWCAWRKAPPVSLCLNQQANTRAHLAYPNVCTIGTVPMLAGIPVAPELAARVDEAAATTLCQGLERGRATFALTIEEREQILRALEDCPDGLAELRGVLVREHEWRLREGLV
jgi:hypothetical protein